MVSEPVRPPESDKDPIWEIYRTFPIIGQNNDGTLYHYQWQKIIDALNVLLSQGAGGGGTTPLPGGSLNIVEATADYTMDTTDDVVLVKTSTGPLTITLPALTPTEAGKLVVIKDALGNSETNYIEVDPGTSYIDSPQSSPNQNSDLVAGNFHIEEDFASLNFLWVGSFWHVV